MRAARARAGQQLSNRGGPRSAASDRGSPRRRPLDRPAGRAPLRRCRRRAAHPPSAPESRRAQFRRHCGRRERAGVGAQRLREPREQRFLPAPRHRVVVEVVRGLGEVLDGRVLLEQFRHDELSRPARSAARPMGAAGGGGRSPPSAQSRDRRSRADSGRAPLRASPSRTRRRRRRPRAARPWRARRAASAAASRARGGRAPPRSDRASAASRAAPGSAHRDASRKSPPRFAAGGRRASRARTLGFPAAARTPAAPMPSFSWSRASRLAPNVAASCASGWPTNVTGTPALRRSAARTGTVRASGRRRGRSSPRARAATPRRTGSRNARCARRRVSACARARG